MPEVKNTVPVYDICSLSGDGHLHGDLIAMPFAPYLELHPNLYRPHRHTFYHLVLFTRGAGFHTIDFERFPVQPGQLYGMVPGQVHSWAFEGAVDGYVVNFSEELFRSFLADDRYLERFALWSGVAAEGVVQLPPEELTEGRRLLQRVVDERTAGGPYALDLIRMSLLELFVRADRSVKSREGAGEPALPNQVVLHNFLRLVNQYYHRYKLPKDYAALLYITPNHLNALCKDLLGKPAGEVIRERILLEAKRLLVHADKSIAEIGYQLGFTDNSYFTRFFKKYTGQTPEAFKNGLLRSS